MGEEEAIGIAEVLVELDGSLCRIGVEVGGNAAQPQFLLFNAVDCAAHVVPLPDEVRRKVCVGTRLYIYDPAVDPREQQFQIPLVLTLGVLSRADCGARVRHDVGLKYAMCSSAAAEMACENVTSRDAPTSQPSQVNPPARHIA